MRGLSRVWDGQKSIGASLKNACRWRALLRTVPQSTGRGGPAANGAGLGSARARTRKCHVNAVQALNPRPAMRLDSTRFLLANKAMVE